MPTFKSPLPAHAPQYQPTPSSQPQCTTFSTEEVIRNMQEEESRARVNAATKAWPRKPMSSDKLQALAAAARAKAKHDPFCASGSLNQKETAAVLSDWSEVSAQEKILGRPLTWEEIKATLHI